MMMVVMWSLAPANSNGMSPRALGLLMACSAAPCWPLSRAFTTFRVLCVNTWGLQVSGWYPVCSCCGGCAVLEHP